MPFSIAVSRYDACTPPARWMLSPDPDREILLDTLLNSLAAERYVRGPLLLTIVDELSTCRLAAAAAARMLLDAIESGEMTEPEFPHQVEALRRLVHQDA